MGAPGARSSGPGSKPTTLSRFPPLDGRPRKNSPQEALQGVCSLELDPKYLGIGASGAGLTGLFWGWFSAPIDPREKLVFRPEITYDNATYHGPVFGGKVSGRSAQHRLRRQGVSPA